MSAWFNRHDACTRSTHVAEITGCIRVNDTVQISKFTLCLYKEALNQPKGHKLRQNWQASLTNSYLDAPFFMLTFPDISLMLSLETVTEKRGAAKPCQCPLTDLALQTRRATPWSSAVRNSFTFWFIFSSRQHRRKQLLMINMVWLCYMIKCFLCLPILLNSLSLSLLLKLSNLPYTTWFLQTHKWTYMYSCYPRTH